MRISRIQYTVQADFAAQNQKNIRAVMQEMGALNATNIKYASYVLDDGKTFMHLVHDNSNGESQLPTSLASFKHFQAELKDHLEVSPKVETLEVVGSSFEIF